MPEEALLSELCTICFTEKPKYRCPRCTTRTCSLPCYKRHQQRASCNGKRDQAIYVKKSELATPAGIDHDYNYLKSVERTIDSASREAIDRGVNGHGDGNKVFERGLHPTSLLQRYLTTNRITVTRAPRGMSRQKSNQTRSSKRQRVMWTVEWMDADGHRDVQHNCLESSTLDDSYKLLQLEQDTALRKSTAGNSSERKVKRRRIDKQPSDSSSSKQPAGKGLEDELGSSDVVDPAADKDVNETDGVNSTSLDEKDSAASGSNAVCNTNQGDHFFYLLRTGTTCTSKVLVPLDSSASLTQSLKDRTVLEYPTIFVLTEPPDSLPAGFLLEKEYNKICKGEEEEFQDALRALGPQSKLQPGKSETKDEVPSHADAQRILDMLKRDITR